MLRDRKALMEQEIQKLTTECGQMYLSFMLDPTGDPAGIHRKVYESKVMRLANMKIELGIIDKLIEQGNP